MKNNILQKYTALAALTLSAFALTMTVSAEEDITYLESEQVYEVDLNGDGTTEQLSYQTYANETDGSSNAVLDIYVNDELLYSVTEENWSYYWTLDSFSLEDGKTYLLACSISDSDWNPQCLLLAAAPEFDSLYVVEDLALITRESDEFESARISSWGRCSFVSESKGNTFTVPWFETLMSTGMISVPVVYEVAYETLEESDITVPHVILPEASVSLDAEQIWTAWYEFDVFTEPAGDTIAFHVNAGDTVSLTEVSRIDGTNYVKCIDQNGTEGWFPDPEEYISEKSADGETYLSGYFEEAIFGG